MKRFFTIYGFELKSYINNKSFTITTLLLIVLLCAGTFLPRFIDMSDMLGLDKPTNGSAASDDTSDNSGASSDSSDEADSTIGLVDETGIFKDLSILKQAFSDTEIVTMKSEKELKKAVKSEKISAGFDVKDDLNYEYYVLNRNMYDENQAIFESFLSQVHQQIYCEQNDLDYASFSAGYDAPVNCTERILGKDAGDNYWYCYALVVVIFMMIILYGVMVATSVTVEKSNRSIEVLVTSVDAKYLLFGKVFAGATAAIVQLGSVLLAALAGYSVNHTYWGDKLDMLLKIPGSVLAGFAIFGIGGFLFYAFLRSHGRTCLQNRGYQQICRHAADADHDRLLYCYVPASDTGQHDHENLLLPSIFFLLRHVCADRHGKCRHIRDCNLRRDPFRIHDRCGMACCQDLPYGYPSLR